MTIDHINASIHYRPGQTCEIVEYQGKGKRRKKGYLVVAESWSNVILWNGHYTFAVSKTDLFYGFEVDKV